MEESTIGVDLVRIVGVGGIVESIVNRTRKMVGVLGTTKVGGTDKDISTTHSFFLLLCALIHFSFFMHQNF